MCVAVEREKVEVQKKRREYSAFLLHFVLYIGRHGEADNARHSERTRLLIFVCVL
jgi:hypothetical protein